MTLLTALLGVGVGCSAGPSSTIDCWTTERGGVLVDARQDRAERTLARLSIANVTSKRLSIAVLDTSSIGAFSWPSGQVFVTRGLIDLVDDDEFCAAIAHEAGHLVADGHLPPPAALDGYHRSSRQNCEGRRGSDGARTAQGIERGRTSPSATPEEDREPIRGFANVTRAAVLPDRATVG
jgi:hypothetical protein